MAGVGAWKDADFQSIWIPLPEFMPPHPERHHLSDRFNRHRNLCLLIGTPKDIVTTWMPNITSQHSSASVCTATQQPLMLQLELVAVFHPEIQFDLKEHSIATFSTKPGTVKWQIRAEHKQTLCSRKTEKQPITPRLDKLQKLVLRELSYQVRWWIKSSWLSSVSSDNENFAAALPACPPTSSPSIPKDISISGCWSRQPSSEGLDGSSTGQDLSRRRCTASQK